MAKPTIPTARSFTPLKNTFTVVSGLAIGVGILMAMVSGRPPANEIDAIVAGTSALTIPLVQTVFEPKVKGLGTITPDFEINVLSEVAGHSPPQREGIYVLIPLPSPPQRGGDLCFNPPPEGGARGGGS